MVQFVYIELITLIPVSVITALIGLMLAETYTSAKIERVGNTKLQIPCCNIAISPNTMMVLNWGVFGFSIVTEMFMICLFLSETEYLPLGLVVLFTRITNPFVVCYILYQTFARRKEDGNGDVKLSKIDGDEEKALITENVFHLQPFNDRLLTVFIIGAALYEVSMLAFLPWQNKELYVSYIPTIRKSKLFHACVGTLSPIIWLIYSVRSEVASSIAIVSISLATSFFILAYRLVLIFRKE